MLLGLFLRNRFKALTAGGVSLIFISALIAWRAVRNSYKNASIDPQELTPGDYKVIDLSFSTLEKPPQWEFVLRIEGIDKVCQIPEEKVRVITRIRTEPTLEVYNHWTKCRYGLLLQKAPPEE